MYKRIVEDKAFLRRVMAVTIPIMIQNAITNFVSMLDNIMVGQVGQVPMSGVSIANQLIFIFNLCIFGATAGAGIFTAQFYGCQNHEGIRHTFRFKILSSVLLSAAGAVIFLQWSDPLINLYLTGEGDPAMAAEALAYGKEYLMVMLFGLLPFALSTSYASTLREAGETKIPMIGGIVAVFVNLILNYVLIFGHFGAPAMGVRGAAWATVISRFAELGFIAVWTHTHGKLHPFIRGAYRSIYIPGNLLLRIILKGSPLLVNEFLWSTGTATLNQCYSTCGLDVVPAINIASTMFNLGSVAFVSMGNAVAIIMGQMLGSNEPESRVRDSNQKLIAISTASGVLFGGLMMIASGMFPMLYKATDSVRHLSTWLICISGVMLPFHAIAHSCYFTLRSGGKTLVTFLFDCGFMWGVSVLLAFTLSRFTGISIIPLYAICNGMDIIKSFLGLAMVRKGTWIQNLAELK